MTDPKDFIPPLTGSPDLMHTDKDNATIHFMFLLRDLRQLHENGHFGIKLDEAQELVEKAENTYKDWLKDNEVKDDK